MADIVERLRLSVTKGHEPTDEDAIAAAAEIEWLREQIEDACKVFDHYDLPEHALHYRRLLERRAAALTGKP